MISSATDDRMARGVTLLLEACDARPQIRTRLAAEGFTDISLSDAITLAAIAINSETAGEITRRLGITETETRQTIDTLAGRGYLKLPDNRDDSDVMAAAPTSRGWTVIHQSIDATMDSRWADLSFRHDDIVVSTPAKSGTTWMQMICALLIFQTPQLPAPISELSVWPDDRSETREEAYAKLAAQKHRRILKTHKPLNEITVNPQVTYIVVARHPLDSAISLYHQTKNMDTTRRDKRGKRPLDGPREWLLRWIDMEPKPNARHSSLPGVLWHLSDAWARRGEPNLVLLHYEDLSADLAGEMRRLASRLDIHVAEQTWPTLVDAATFRQMKAAADRLRPLGDSLKDNTAFFRRGTSGAAGELLTGAELARYHARAAQLAPADLLAWLHRQVGPTQVAGQ